jgi:hypothetical protein
MSRRLLPDEEEILAIYDFEQGLDSLDDWYCKTNSCKIVEDPVNSLNHVLTFEQKTFSGDMFTFETFESVDGKDLVVTFRIYYTADNTCGACLGSAEGMPGIHSWEFCDSIGYPGFGTDKPIQNWHFCMMKFPSRGVHAHDGSGAGQTDQHRLMMQHFLGCSTTSKFFLDDIVVKYGSSLPYIFGCHDIDYLYQQWLDELCPCDEETTPFKNKGQFVKCAAHFHNELYNGGLITLEEKDALQSEAAHIPFPCPSN